MQDNNQIEEELLKLKEEVKVLTAKRNAEEAEDYVTSLVRYIAEEREKTNRMLGAIMDRMKRLEQKLESTYVEEEYQKQPYREYPLPNLDVGIIDFIQSKGMVCADDLKSFMNYRGRNAACARLNRLWRAGILERMQIGHKVYYRFDAGKAANTLIISPPQ